MQRHGFIDLYDWARGRHDPNFVPRMQRGGDMDDSAHGGNLDPEALKLEPKISITPGGRYAGPVLLPLAVWPPCSLTSRCCHCRTTAHAAVRDCSKPFSVA